MRQVVLFSLAAAMVSAGVLVVDLASSTRGAEAHDPTDFAFVEVITNLDRPTGVEVAPNGDIFVIEKNGKLKVFNGFSDPTADIVANWESRTMSTGDQGMLGLAVDPQYGNGRNYVYVQYVLDEVPGENDPPHWNDNCPVAQTDGCEVTSSLARIEVDPSTNAMIGWIDLLTSTTCLQFNGHSANDLIFGPDGYLYSSIGDGASFIVSDYGQLGGNPCEDPPFPAQPTTANGEGGALRSMDLLTSVGGEANDPVWYNGVVLRIDPDTGQAAPGNPLTGGTVIGDDRIIGHGLRNPYRIDFRPGTDELWIADVGWGAFEEINVIADVDDAVVENFGWPCYEGPQLHAVYSQYGLCQTLINNPGSFDLTTQLTDAHFPYDHADAVGDCAGGSSAVTALAFGATGGQYPTDLDGALFFNDFARGCLWAMLTDSSGVPDPATIETLATGVIIVDLHIAPNGDLLVVEVGDFSNGAGRVRRLDFLGGNLAPTAVITANTLTGTENVTLFEFDGTDSSDPEGGALTYEWDLDGDGTFDATGPMADITYTDPGSYAVKLRVTDPGGAADETTVTANVSNTPPVPTIVSPTASETWSVGDELTFSATATDAEDGPLAPDTPGLEWEWVLVVQHCPSFDCHAHVEGNWIGVSSGSFSTADHEYPSWIELSLTVYDSTGAAGTTSVELQPRTSTITLDTVPGGLQVAGGVAAQPQTAPFAIEAIEGGDVSVVAPSPQTVGSTQYAFQSWSDGGNRIHDVVVGVDDTTLTADYIAVVAGFRDGWTGVAPSGGWSYWWNEGGPLGDASTYSALQWNGSYYDSDGLPGSPSADNFSYGLVADWGVHAGKSTAQGAGVDRNAIIRHTVASAGTYAIVDSLIVDRDCATGGVDVTVLANNTVVATINYVGPAASDFDTALGPLAVGDTIDVAIGPGTSDTCDAVDLDFALSQTASEPGGETATYSEDFTGPVPGGGWSYLWNENGAIGDSAGYTPLTWNTIHYDSDGLPGGASADDFSYGLVAAWGLHPGRGTNQGTTDERFAIVRYTVPTTGAYSIANSFTADRGCIGGGVVLQVRVNDGLVSTMNHSGTSPVSFDTSLGNLAAGDTIDVAVGPDKLNVCDAVDLDFTVVDGEPDPTQTVTVGTFSENRGETAAVNGWTFWWNESGAVGDESGYSRLLWNGTSHDSDGTPSSPSADQFAYGRVAAWGVHPGRGTGQAAAEERNVIVRYTVAEAGVFDIVSSVIDDLPCTTFGGVDIEILVDSVSVYSALHFDTTPGSFDMTLGALSPGTTIDVAVGPNGFDWCDATDLDFTLQLTS